MSSPPSTTSHAVLGLLSLRAWTTYELAKQVQRSVGWFWPRAERKLYEIPKQLVAAGLASAKREMTGARPRTVYTVNARGRRELARWLDEPPSPPSLEFEGLVKVFFADGGTLEQLRQTLTSICEAADERVAELDDKVAQLLTGDVPFPERIHLNSLSIRYQLEHERSIARWARWALEQTAEWQSTTDPGSWDYRRSFEDAK